MPSIIKRPENVVSIPALDVYENDKEFVLILDMPGVTESQVSVRLDGELLAIRGAREGGTYERELLVPKSVDAEGVTATAKAGVLTVTLPKQPARQPRQITVRAA